MIEIKLDELLEERGRSFYWLSKNTGISYTTLWRLKKGNALGINFATLLKICAALECEPGDILKLNSDHEHVSKMNRKSQEKAANDRLPDIK